MDLTIVRSKWLHGGIGDSMLLDNAGNMCCLGFYSLACGHSKEDIQNVTEPLYVKNWRGAKREDADIYYSMMRVNDDEILSEAQREQEIAEYFKALGVNVTFVD